MDDYEIYEEEPEWEQQIDDYFLGAQKDIQELYEKDLKSVYFIRQLQVKFEKKYFHWITNNAIIQLYNFGYLKDIRKKQNGGASTRYFFHRSNRYPKRRINEIEKVIREYSQPHITRSCGERAEILFCKALAKRGFLPVAEKVKEYNGKKWEETGHDLDFVFRKDNLEYGCEIKNTLGYIDKEEMEIKIKMCEYFNVKPLFIMRYSPKIYNYEIIESGGFVLIFECQIYELSQVELVKKIRDVIEYPVDYPKSIPDGIIDRFEKWHNKNVN
jgi:hypothetical protein